MIVNQFLPDTYFSSEAIIPEEKNKGVLISVLSKTNKGEIGKRLSFYMMSLMCFLLKKLKYGK
jgi:hypothetical protein